MILKCYERQLPETINVNTVLSFIFNPTLSSLHLNCINKTFLPAPNLPPYCVYFLTLFFSPSYFYFFPSGIYLRCLCLSLSLSLFASLIHFSQHYGVISAPVIQSEGQQKSLPASNRLLSEAESTDTFAAGITLFHY